jgi:hypothetical protein
VGRWAVVRAVRPEPGPPGVVFALKSPRREEAESGAIVEREARILQELTLGVRPPPCPAVHDVVGEGASTAAVLDWCPESLEDWWVARRHRSGSVGDLCQALAEVSRRAAEVQGFLMRTRGEVPWHASITPRRVLKGPDGRWVLSDFGAIRADGSQAAGPEAFSAPEVLYRAKVRHPGAVDTWAVAACLLAMLSAAPSMKERGLLPPGGLEGLRFRSHRAGLVLDLHSRKPSLFKDLDLDPRQFLFAEALPDLDRQAVIDGLSGAFGRADAAREAPIAAEVLALLDKALSIDPARRFADPLDLAGALDELAHRCRELCDLEAPTEEMGSPPEPR